MALRRVVSKLHSFIALMFHIFSMLFLKAAGIAMRKVKGLCIGGEHTKCNVSFTFRTVRLASEVLNVFKIGRLSLDL